MNKSRLPPLVKYSIDLMVIIIIKTSFILCCCLFVLDVKQVVVNNFIERMDLIMRPYLPGFIQQHIVEKKKVGVLISGSGTNLQALIDATLDPTIHIGAEIVLVISNKPNVDGLKRAERANIPTKVSILFELYT